MNKRLLKILACPTCKGALTYIKFPESLKCPLGKVTYPIVDGIPDLRPNNSHKKPKKSAAIF